MKRFLFVVPPLAGHVNPTVSVARALVARGHRVAWVGHPRRVRPLLPEDAELIALDDGVSDEVWRPVLDRARSVRGLASLQFLWEDVLVPLARGMLPGVTDAIKDFAPDVVAVDHQAIGGALAARRAGVRWATLCTTSASVVDPLSDLPRVKDWVRAQVEDLQRQAGVPVAPDADLSPQRVVVFSTEALVGAADPFPAHYRFVGPSISDRPDATPFPWDALGLADANGARDAGGASGATGATGADGNGDGGRPGATGAARVPVVFVSLGTVSADIGAAFYAIVALALADAPVRVVLAAPPEQVPSPPQNFIVRARVPQLALLPHVDAVVCHGGHNTVCEALAHGLPLVVAPIRDDQPVIAGQVVRAGAGVRVKFGRLSPAALRSAVTRALGDPDLRVAAARLKDSFTRAGGAPAAATALEEMT